MDEQDLQQLNNEDGATQQLDSSENIEPTASGEAVRKPRSKKVSKIIDIVLWVLIAVLAVALIIRMFFYTQITISGESMTSGYYATEQSELTFHDEDVVGVSKLRKPQRGDVVVFYKNDGKNKFWDVFASKSSGDDDGYTKLIKRIVAVAGDKLWVEQVEDASNVYRVLIETPEGVKRENEYARNGKTLAEEAFYIKDVADSGLGILSEHIGKENALTVSDGCFFAMGDNRSNSRDSREFGEVPLKRLFGVVTKY